ncbi:MAG: cob(I)yrinic acid a,c-diamide adenosyltransferase [Alphaproteobacteria bacterium]|nr:cob(I)yrinic acid a,c-diamide adenosyltransferase [Alphaproteobacteria bacterium]
MRITKVYTRVGDRGTTRLAGGQEVAKDHARIEAYGTIDELNAVLGLVRTFNARSDADDASTARLDAMLHRIQNDLFNVGADLATLPADRWKGMVLLSDADVTRLEDWIDELNADLGPLRDFILPGGGPVGAFLHQARTVCRRAERRLVEARRLEPDIDETAVRYVNRLSDWAFVAGRWAAKALGEEEHLWEKPARD